MKTRLLYIECGNTFNTELITGIQRAVRNLTREIEHVAPLMGYQPIFISSRKGNFYQNSIDIKPLKLPKGIKEFLNLLKSYSIYIKFRSLIAPLVHFIRNRVVDPSELTFEPVGPDGFSSVLLLIDSTWDVEILPKINEFRVAGGKVCAVLYDLIPFSHPSTVEASTRLLFEKWWCEALNHTDYLMCISQTVRQEFITWQKQTVRQSSISEEKIGFFHLGANLTDATDPVMRLLSENEPYFLVVGSIEPRKNHITILEAFELLWGRGSSVRLAVVWRNEWKTESLIHRLANHPQKGRKLFLIKDTTDRELAALYLSASGLINASVIEGFGLPLVEAGALGVPIICSDIPVFREVGGDYPTYFHPLQSEDLARCVSGNVNKIARHSAKKMKNVINWKSSAEQLLRGLDLMSQPTK
jgi:glycosyltransferase involved in cell wall biosynthesis